MVDAAAIGAGIAERIKAIRLALDRQQAFVFAPDEPPRELAAAESAATAEHLVLRALRTAADPVNHGLLMRLRDDDSSLAELSRRFELSPVSTWEHVNDLIQNGLVGRSFERDLVGLSEAGREYVAFVEAIIESATATAAADSDEGGGR